MSVKISPWQIERAMSEAGKLRALLGDEDDKLVHDTLEGETDVFEVIDKIGEATLSDMLLVGRAEERITRLKARIEARKGTLARMMDALSIGKSLERALFTLGLETRTKAIITDADKLDPKYIRKSPDTTAVTKDLRRGEFVGEGAELSNATVTVRITSK